ncbi:MAG TPA: peptidase MA family metallohydrolase [Thermoanaerobaculia bacterium]|nr:peptidase MA family metallohydrolase [Thermoanaerobaculia bacterium]HUM30302.1 peptidase MA family metallohydrolase [Thermoanaerobaculia bacterium]HXK68547.1 peptidase MA family metallohydrolase [Thermoanaerobaculia bacterium]
MLKFLTLLIFLQTSPFVVHAPKGYEDFESWIRTAGEERLKSMEQSLGVPLPRGYAVYLIPPDQGDLPDWAAGWASPGRITLRIRKMEDVPEVFTHELAHAIIWNASGHNDLPRWFQEGLAMYLAGESTALWSRVVVSVEGGPSLISLNHTFPSEGSAVTQAYAKSYLAVHVMIRRVGMEGIRTLLSEVRRGKNFDTILMDVAGLNIPGLDSTMKRRVRWSYVYLPLITSSSFLWLALTVFFIVVYIRKRTRAREILASWEDEANDPDVPCDETLPPGDPGVDRCQPPN